MKQLKDHPDYFINRAGGIFSTIGRGRWLKPVPFAKGFRAVHIRDRTSIGRMHLVHRLVAETFVPNPFGFKLVFHKNGDRSDNRVDNLAWTNKKPRLGQELSVVHKGRNTLGLKHITNGTKNKMIPFASPVPEEWRLGLTLKKRLKNVQVP